MSRDPVSSRATLLPLYDTTGQEGKSTGRKKIEDGYKDAVARYQAKNVQRIVMGLNRKTDADILQKLSEVESKQGYIKDLIRKDIAKGATNTQQ